jgi:hypothetical protein
LQLQEENFRLRGLTNQLLYLLSYASQIRQGHAITVPFEAGAILTLNRRDLMRLIGGQLSISDLVSLGLDSIAGSHLDLASFLSVIEKDDRYYDLVPMPTG